MTDASLVTQEILGRVIGQRAGVTGASNALELVAAREPILGSYVFERLMVLAGKLAVSGAPPDIVRGCCDDILDVVTIAVRAVWAGHDELWHGVDLRRLSRKNCRLKSRRARMPVKRDNDAALAPGSNGATASAMPSGEGG